MLRAPVRGIALALAAVSWIVVPRPAASAEFGPFTFKSPSACRELGLRFSATVTATRVTAIQAIDTCGYQYTFHLAGDTLTVSWPDYCMNTGDSLSFMATSNADSLSVLRAMWSCAGGGPSPTCLANYQLTAADRLDVWVMGPLFDAQLVTNAPGCLTPSLTVNGDPFEDRVTFQWPIACVDYGEQVCFLVNGQPAIVQSYQWSVGTPAGNICPPPGPELVAPAADASAVPGGAPALVPGMGSTSAAALGGGARPTARAQSYEDVVSIGHVASPTGLPGTPGGAGPYHVGRGPGDPGSPNGVWDWDHFQPGEGDSLMGWWPIRLRYELASPPLSDVSRPWFALDYGNQANYVLNQRSPARTFGVVGVWHADPGSSAGTSVAWNPIHGVRSAWCGLRSAGDASVIDPITGNPFNQSVLDFNGLNSPAMSGTSKRFPGYGSQWDQMLYRDISLSDGASLDLTFCYVSRMSSSRSSDPATRTGWYDKDPLATVAGNFISSTNAGPNAPIDSFMVYVGAPVNDAACTYSDGSVRPVYDRMRRWFSEVLRVNDGTPYREVLSASGNHGWNGMADGVRISLPNSAIQPMLDAQGGPGGTLRLVFRVKTNREFDDQDGGVTGYGSGNAGAVVLDWVTANGTMIGDFESPGDINNSPGASPVLYWKSTGKPPQVYFHLHPLSTLVWNDLCGPPGSPNSQCQMTGNVISTGDHDRGEAAGGELGAAEQERMDGIVSPTINLRSSGPGDFNGWGVDETAAKATGDYLVRYDVYTGIYNLMFTGNAWIYGFQSYPAQQSNGGRCWGELRVPAFEYFEPEPRCYTMLDAAFGQDLIHTSNADGYPDSVRVFLGKIQQCFRFAVSLGCSPTTGGYFDNVTVQLVNVPGANPVGAVAVAPWNWINDAFPANSDPSLPGRAAFDTTSACLRTGLNLAPETGNLQRLDLPGDSIVATAPGNNVRLDLVFRILPGPGNYAVPGDRNSGLRRTPTNPAVAQPGDASFWGQYLQANGAFGTPGGHPGGRWSEDVWNSARCDTAELNLFPLQSQGNLPGIVPGIWAATYHEADPKFSTLGIPKNRCFVVDPLQPPAGSNITCGAGSYPPFWVQFQGSGYDGNTITREYTKIIPDGLLTPGSHVQYFLRKSLLANPAAFAMAPDTDRVYPQRRAGSLDGHRFEEFSVLPDAWKFPQYGGLGAACMLYVDLCDGRGAERVWVGVADSIGATRAQKWGAHNGWHAPGGVDYTDAIVSNNPAIAVAHHGGQAGTTWDMYGVKGNGNLTISAGDLGSRYARQPVAGSPADGRQSTQGPTTAMLGAYYRMLMLLSGDLGAGVLGPYIDRSQNDIGLVEAWLLESRQYAPRGILAEGSGFVESEFAVAGIVPDHQRFLDNDLHVSLRDGYYAGLSGNLASFTDLTPGPLITTRDGPFGVRNPCVSNDVLRPAQDRADLAVSSWYASTWDAFGAGVAKLPTAVEPWYVMVDGWNIADLLSRFGDTSGGRRVYYLDALSNFFGGLCALTGSPTVDTPPAGRRLLGNMMAVQSENPLRRGLVRLAFALEHGGRASITIFDVAGRRVRILADRVFQAGVEHDLMWDGRDDAGRSLGRGVYYWQVRSPAYVSTRKLIVLN
jgi:hypothetical protein